MASFVASIVRHLLTLLSGAIGVEGIASDNNVQIIASALITIVTILWSFIEKKYLAKK